MRTSVNAKHKKAKYWISKKIINDLRSFRDLEKRIEAVGDKTDQEDILPDAPETTLH